MKHILCSLLLGFLILFSTQAEAATLVSGTTISGTISKPPASVVHTFTATAGENFVMHGVVPATNLIYIGITRPDGSSMGASSNRQWGYLSQTGTYTVTLTLNAGAPVGAHAYTLSFVKSASTVSDGSITSGSATNASLGVNEMRSYQFSGVAGRAAFIRAGSASYTAVVTVYNPDGSLLGSAYNMVNATLPATGTYMVVVEAQYYASTGDYGLYLLMGNDTVSEGELNGQPYETTLARGQIRSFTFEGASGKYAMARIVSSVATWVGVLNPDGSVTSGKADNYGFSIYLPAQSGKYTLYVYGNPISGNGEITLHTVIGASTLVSNGTAESGLQRNGELMAPGNGLDGYIFTGTSTNNLTISSSGAYNRVFMIMRPDGTPILGPYTNSASITLPATGTYTMAVYGGHTSYDGPYSFTLTTTPIPPDADTPDLVEIPPEQNQCTTCPCQPETAAGNPINFSAGYKQQTEVDYNTAGLYFARIYRSDSSWTNNTVGTFWRHNYARTLSVTGSTSYIIDGSGTKRTYTLVSSVWVPDDPSNTSKLETITGGYKYTLHNGTVEKYDSTPKLTRIEYLGGGALNLTYNGSSQLTGVANENGRTLQLTYSSGKVATLVTPDGTFSYSYTSNNLTTVTKPDTKTIIYHYENGSYPSALTGITDQKGNRFATFAYNGSGKAISTEHAGGVQKYQVAYNTNDSTVTNPLTKNTAYYYRNINGVRRITQAAGAASANCPASSMYYGYDLWGRLTVKQDAVGNITRYAYDSRSNLIRMAEAAGTGIRRMTYITWDPTFNLPNLVTEPGLYTDYDYDTYGRLVTMTQTDALTSATRITTYTYHSNGTDGSGNVILGRLAQIDGPRTDVSDTTDFDYDGNLNVTKITNALGQETDITARDAAGRPTTVEDANNTEIDLVYDTNGWLDTATRAPGTGLQAVYDFDYDFNGNLVKVTLPNGVFVEYSYDNAQRLTGIEDSLGNTVAYTLNNAGNATQVDVSNTTPAVTYTHDQTFDELMRLLTSVGAASQTATYAYDKNSNLTSYTDPEANTTTFTYDALQRFKTSTNALSGVTTLGYTGLDDVNSVTDQRNHSTTYTYNAFGDVVGEVSPDRGTLAYVVDKAGNVTQRTDARSVVTNFTYDALDRPLTVAYPADSSLNATLTYDASSGCGTAYKGRLCTVADATGTTTYVYDILGRVTSASENRGGGLTLATSYTYDLAGNIATITLPSGRVVTYTRNANGLVSNVAAPVNGSSVNLASGITYLPFGPLNALTYGNSLTLSATFDTDYNPTNRTISGGIANWTYTTDDNGNVTQAGATTYGYDALNRVNAENAGAATSYTYDATDNRLTKVQGGTTTTTVPSANNKISAVGGTSYTYDAAGNITAIGTNGYVWSAAGLMSEYKISGVSTATYTYNAFNQRTKKVTGGVTTHYVYGAGGLLMGEYTSAGAMVREYVYLNSAPLAQVNSGSPETVTYLHTDHLGTPRFGTNSGGTQVWSWNNDAFGVSTPSGSATVNIRMPGQYADTESGLFYNWNRYYNPAIGRYISSDPIGLAGGLNTFGYVAQNPVMGIDPEGLQSVTPVPGVPGLPIPFIPPIAIPGSPENQQWVQWMQGILSMSGDTPQDKKAEGCAEGTKTGKDPCKELRNRVVEHQQKLFQYAFNPLSMDNLGVLSQALEQGNLDLAQKIYAGRIAYLIKEINKLQNELKKCEGRNGL